MVMQTCVILIDGRYMFGVTKRMLGVNIHTWAAEWVEREN